uniref:Uncharacterized protein n=1 Tax=Setaria italica TaxID=4555 RepID=K3ZBM6_SETIT
MPHRGKGPSGRRKSATRGRVQASEASERHGAARWIWTRCGWREKGRREGWWGSQGQNRLFV